MPFWLSAATIFLSAFLLFLVQPILAKLILPRFGGGAAIWATCLVFFQAAMLAGYAGAHALVRLDHARALRVLHLVLLVASLLLLPIVPAAHWQVQAGQSPSVVILGLLVATIGAPFVLLATTSPLLQAWIASAPTPRNPYRLFAVSNAASLAALVGYPWAVEPFVAAERQAVLWSVAYAVYAAAIATLALSRWRWTASVAASGTAESEASAPSAGAWFGWTGLAALASYQLVAVTNHLTQNVPSFPMMWIAPLALYLLTFALCFDSDRWYRPRLFRFLLLLALPLMAWMLADVDRRHDLTSQSITFLASLFVACMFCHGELARTRPAPRFLTRFYLAVAAGGVAGGALVGLAAPALLPGYFEIEAGLMLLALALLLRAPRDSAAWLFAGWLSLIGSGITAAWVVQERTKNLLEMSRNFYGVVRVREHGQADDPMRYRSLVHGSILHGWQYLSPERRRTATSYYGDTSGVARLLNSYADRPVTVGVIGLGVGTLATWGKAGDHYRFYDIDPAVVDAARRWFSFLADSPARVEVEIGDGRLLLQAEPPARFDALVIDAFSSDSIPVHLLTREAVGLYASRIKPSGVIALHISNRYLNLRPVVVRLAADAGLRVALIEDAVEDNNPEKSSSVWMLLSRDADALAAQPIASAAAALPESDARHAWTDDYSNIVGVLRPPWD